MTDEQLIKDLLQRSQLKAGEDFTKELSRKLAEELKSSPEVVTWSLGRIIGGFVVVTLACEALLFLYVRAFTEVASGVVPDFLLPIIWSLLLTVGLSYVLRYTRLLRHHG